MNRKLFALALISSYCFTYSQVGINTQSPHPSSVLDVNSDSKGMLLPRLSTVAVNSLSSTASEGLIVFDRDLKTFMGWDGTKWINLGYEEINTVPNATNVLISGNYSVGSSLTGGYTFSDAQSNPDDASTFIWRKADDAAGTNVSVITSATAQNYIIAAGDLGKFLQFCVTPGSSVGASPGAQKCSAWGGPAVANQAPTASGLSITGNPAIGQTLTATYNYADAENNPQGTSIFRWTHADDASGTNETVISGATAATYTVAAGDVGKYIKFYVTPVATTGTTTGNEVGSSYKGPIVSLSSGTIFTQNFESGETVNYTSSGFSSSSLSFTSGNNSGAPTTALYSTATRGYGYSNSTTGTVTSTYVIFNTIDASSYTNNITLSFDLAAFSKTTGNGMENDDLVTVEVSTDGGTTYSTKLTVLGGNSAGASNVRWDFSGTGAATNDFASTNVTVTSPNTATTGNGITITGADAITKLSVTGIPNSSQLRVRIGLRNNSSGEQWVIDNVKLQAL